MTCYVFLFIMCDVLIVWFVELTIWVVFVGLLFCCCFAWVRLFGFLRLLFDCGLRLFCDSIAISLGFCFWVGCLLLLWCLVWCMLRCLLIVYLVYLCCLFISCWFCFDAWFVLVGYLLNYLFRL